MTREQAKEFMWLENNKNPSVIKWQHHKTIRDLVEKLIDQIFSDHEAQLKLAIELGEKQALEFDRFFDAFGLKSNDISIDDAICIFKAKDELTDKLYKAYAEADYECKALGVQLAMKDEEIENMKLQLSSVHNLMYRNGYSDAIDCYDTFRNFNTRHKPNAKARLIVAMLFWEWRRNRRLLKELKEKKADSERIIIHTGFNNATKFSFYKAYKILKEQQ